MFFGDIMVISALFATILILAIVSYLFEKELYSPSVLFLVPFWVAVCNLISNIKIFDFELHWNTYFVILNGLIFYLFGIVSADLYNPKIRFVLRKKEKSVVNQKLEKAVGINTSFFVYHALFQIVSLFYCFYRITLVAKSYGYSGSFSALIGGYRYLSTFTTESISLGKIGNLLYNYCSASGYVCVYLMIYFIIRDKKLYKILLFNIIISLIINLSKGGRQSTIQLIFAGFIMYIIMYRKSSRKIRLKQLLPIALIATIILITFQNVGGLIGRKVSSGSFNDYIAIYLSAPISNLDYYLQTSHERSDIFGKMTFIRIINYFGSKFHVQELIYELDLPFVFVNGKNHGNVYTTFYAYLYDFGFIGVPVMMFIMGFLCKYFYKKAVYKQHAGINIYILIYSFVSYTIAFSFFSNKFYEGLIAIGFVHRFFSWIVLIYIVNQVGFVYGKNHKEIQNEMQANKTMLLKNS